MKLVFLAAANSIHTQRWVVALSRRGHEVTLLSQHAPQADVVMPGVSLELLPFKGGKGYFLNALHLRKRLRQIKPDLLNVHYASGYGTTAALSGFVPSLLSVWGSDVFDFPYESAWKARILRRNLLRATRLASTSHRMARQVHELMPSLATEVLITPFGVDCDLFCPKPNRDPKLITIGTVKTLEHKYGIDVLIAAFELLRKDPRLMAADVASRLRLLLVGGGVNRDGLETQVQSLGLQSCVTFAGAVRHDEVPQWLNRLDVYVAASRLDSESFGVAVIEASACGVPVVVSDVGGLPEVVDNGVTGLIVPREDAPALAQALARLLLDAALRERMGQAGRSSVVAKYAWAHCVDTMEAAYQATLQACRPVAQRLP